MSDAQALEQRLAILEGELRVLKDIEEIRTLKARYWKACDGDIVSGLSHDYEEIADLYTEDGSWQIATLETPDGTLPGRGGVGREGILEYFKSRREHYRFIMHFGMAPIITVSGDTATGEWHYIATLDAHGGSQAVWAGGTYRDEYVRTEDGWRIKSTVVIGGFATPFDEGWHSTKYIGLVPQGEGR
jgi:ketosteroid isomerase-like protein